MKPTTNNFGQSEVLSEIENALMRPQGNHMDQPSKGINVLALIKEDGERYVFLYDDDSIDTLISLLGEYASNPELGFGWYDAATMRTRIRSVRERPAD